jgi:hypothetical protein
MQGMQSTIIFHHHVPQHFELRHSSSVTLSHPAIISKEKHTRKTITIINPSSRAA